MSTRAMDFNPFGSDDLAHSRSAPFVGSYFAGNTTLPREASDGKDGGEPLLRSKSYVPPAADEYVDMISHFSSATRGLNRSVLWMCFLSLYVIIVSIVQREIDFHRADGDDTAYWTVQVLRMTASVATGFNLYCLLWYYRSQWHFYRISRFFLRNMRVWTCSSMLYFAVECIILAMHEPPFVDVRTSIKLSNDDSPDSVTLNNAWGLLVVLKLYLAIRLIVTRFYTPGTKILGLWSRFKFTNGFVIRNILYTYPFLSLLPCLLSLGFMFTYMMLVCEREKQVSLGSFSVSAWLVSITILGVGYGDLYPQTECGRALSVTGTLIFIIISAVLVAIIYQNLTLLPHEHKMVQFLQFNNVRKQMGYLSARVIQTSFRVFQARRNGASRIKLFWLRMAQTEAMLQFNMYRTSNSHYTLHNDQLLRVMMESVNDRVSLLMWQFGTLNKVERALDLERSSSDDESNNDYSDGCGSNAEPERSSASTPLGTSRRRQSEALLNRIHRIKTSAHLLQDLTRSEEMQRRTISSKAAASVSASSRRLNRNAADTPDSENPMPFVSLSPQKTENMVDSILMDTRGDGGGNDETNISTAAMVARTGALHGVDASRAESPGSPQPALLTPSGVNVDRLVFVDPAIGATDQGAVAVSVSGDEGRNSVEASPLLESDGNRRGAFRTRRVGTDTQPEVAWAIEGDSAAPVRVPTLTAVLNRVAASQNRAESPQSSSRSRLDSSSRLDAPHISVTAPDPDSLSNTSVEDAATIGYDHKSRPSSHPTQTAVSDEGMKLVLSVLGRIESRLVNVERAVSRQSVRHRHLRAEIHRQNQLSQLNAIAAMPEDPPPVTHPTELHRMYDTVAGAGEKEQLRSTLRRLSVASRSRRSSVDSGSRTHRHRRGSLDSGIVMHGALGGDEHSGEEGAHRRRRATVRAAGEEYAGRMASMASMGGTSRVFRLLGPNDDSNDERSDSQVPPGSSAPVEADE